jgi:hypothetical protein
LGLVLLAESITVSLRSNCVLERVENSTRVWVVIRIFRVSPPTGVTAILIYLSGLSSCNARPPFFVFRLRVVRCAAGDPADTGWGGWLRACVRADGGARLSEADLAALAALQGRFGKCVVRPRSPAPHLLIPLVLVRPRSTSR